MFLLDDQQFESSFWNLNSNPYSNPIQLSLTKQNSGLLSSSKTIAFIDKNIVDAETVLAQIQADVKVFIDPAQDGIAQITQTLEHYKDLTGIDIISYGNDAELQLGNSFLNATSLDLYKDQVQNWAVSLAPEADILIYGCNVAAGEAGKSFVNHLSSLTGADVAASTDFTGNAFKGGNWNLEYTTGSIETATPFTSSFISSYQGLLDSFFTATSPEITNASDGTGYELGLQFTSAKSGQIQAVRYWKAPSETGTHVGKIWSSSGQLLASVTFSNETASGWQQQALATPLNIAPNTTYTVSVNINSYYVATKNVLESPITSGDLSALANGGVYGNPGTLPSQSYQSSNYFRDIVFTPTAPVNNNPGTIALSGTATQNQTLTATVTDTDGLNGVTINYQWQQSSDNGNTWTNISGATGQTLNLGQAQVNNKVRAIATYIDTLGSSESVPSTASAAVANVNDPGAIAISGITAQGSTLSATVTDADGLSGATINYQWQQSSDGNTWTNISGATNQTLTLDNSLVGKQVHTIATYTDVFGSSENIVSLATSAIAAQPAQLESIFTASTTPNTTNVSDGVSYELGLKFTSSKNGQVQAIRYWKAPSETGTHVGKIWSSSGQLLGSVTFSNETASGWQQQALTTPLNILANTTYTVSVNINSYYAATKNVLGSPITSGDLSALANGGVYGNTGTLPSQSYQSSNYFRDIVFTPTTPVSNHPGAISVSGTATENQTLTATVSDTDGLTGATINYQWQQSSNNGSTWTNISGATAQTLTLSNAQVGKLVRATANYTDTIGSSESVISSATAAVVNVNDIGLSILRGSATTGHTLTAGVNDDDGLTGVTINYQWQKFENNSWTNIAGATNQTLALDTSLLGKQVRAKAIYTDAHNTTENIFSSGTNVAALNPIVLENQNPGTTNWEITNKATQNEIAGYATATSVNKGETLPIKVSLAQPGQYKIDVYRLGYYGGAGGRLMTSSGLLNGVTQSGSTFDPTTRLVQYNWNTSYNLQIGNNWTTGEYVAKLTDINTGKQSQVWFIVRDDNRVADIGFQSTFTTFQAYNNFGGYSVYNFNSDNQQRAYKVSFDRPFAQTTTSNHPDTMFRWEYNGLRWLESQGYDVSYYTNLDVHTNPLQLHSQNVFLAIGHDEYWSMEMRNNVEKARDSGINLAFLSANTAYWRVRFEPSSTGQANRVMVVYKDDWASDPVAQNDTSQATTLFRGSTLNRPENALMGVTYVGDYSSTNVYGGYNFVVTNSSDPYYAHTGLNNGDVLSGLVGNEWDAVVNNGFTPPGLVILSQSPATSQDNNVPALPPGTNNNIANAVRYTAPSGAKVFSVGTQQWVWGLDSYGVDDPRADSRVKQITTNIFADMGAKPQTPSAGIVVA